MSHFRPPLDWPLGHDRTPARDRVRGRFSKANGKGYQRPITVAEARDRLLAELDRYTKAGHLYRVPPDSVVITSDAQARKDGYLFTNAREPDDPGVAVYFELDGQPVCLPCDTFDRLADNIAAVAGHVEADRTQERYGVGTTAQRYAGFLALPAPGETTGEAWWETLGIVDHAAAKQDDVKRAYRRRAKEAHPDGEGDEAEWHRVSEAYRQGLAATEGR